MGSGNSIPGSGQQPTATNSQLSNAFLSNQPIGQTYQPMGMPSAPSSSFAQLNAQGSLPGLTGSLIGNNGMPPLPQPSGPMPVPQPPVSAAPAQRLARGQYYAPSSLQSVYDKMYESVGKPTQKVVMTTPSHRIGGR